MQQSGPTEIAVSRLKGGASVTQLLHEANGPALGDYLFQFLCKTPRSVETIAGLAGLNKSSLYRILNAEVTQSSTISFTVIWCKGFSFNNLIKDSLIAFWVKLGIGYLLSFIHRT